MKKFHLAPRLMSRGREGKFVEFREMAWRTEIVAWMVRDGKTVFADDG